MGVFSIVAVYFLPGVAARWWNGNFHVVESGALYRSGQLSAQRLNAVITQYGIRTIINLRGAFPGESWYDDEHGVVRQRSVQVEDLSLLPGALPSPAVTRRLVQIFQQADRPILIHCRDGSERTGWAAAVYEIMCKRSSPRAAFGRQLTWRYGHVYPDRYWRVEKFLPTYLQTQNGVALADWLVAVYPLMWAPPKITSVDSP